MRVLFVVNSLGIGGTERVALTMATGLKARGHEVAIHVYHDPGPRAAAARQAGVVVFGPGELDAAVDWRPDLVHIHRYGYPDQQETDLLHILRGSGPPVVETNVFGRFDASDGGGLIDLHLLLSQWCLGKWLAWGGSAARAKRHAILPNPLDLPLLPDANKRALFRASLGIPRPRFMFGRVGQPLDAKWSAAILPPFARLVAEGYDVGLLLLGAPPAILDAIAALPAEARFRIITLPVTGHDPLLRSCYEALDAFLHAARIGESFGLVLCEAMARAVPVITLSTPLKDNSQLEVVGHGVGGLVALDTDALYDAMLALLTDPALCRRLGRRGRAHVAAHYETGVVLDALEIHYASVLTHQPHVSPRLSPSRLRRLASNGIGRPPGRRTWLAFALVHNAWLYRAYLRLWRKLRHA